MVGLVNFLVIMVVGALSLLTGLLLVKLGIDIFQRKLKKSKKCPQCNRLSALDVKFCPYCGYPWSRTASHWELWALKSPVRTVIIIFTGFNLALVIVLIMLLYVRLG